MSGPVDDLESPGTDLGPTTVEVREGRVTAIGRSRILRVLPTKRRRTVGPWCFVDLMAPEDVERPVPLEIGPHPHIGLATVTWLFGGSVLHSDSLGTEQLITPGQLNLMTSGRGIAHAEEGITAAAPAGTGGLVGVQMWLALTDATRNGPSGFQHLADLPLVEFPGATAALLIGEAGGERSPAVVDHPAVGLDVTLRGPATLPIDPRFEHAVVPVDRPLRIEDAIAEPGALAVVPPGLDELRVASQDGPGRFMVLGGEPLGTPVTMWWNFVARSKDEITEAWRAWEAHDDEWFGPVPSSLPRIDAPPPPWLPRT